MPQNILIKPLATDIADKNKIFIIQPNGKATKLSGLWGNNSSLKPGSL